MTGSDSRRQVVRSPKAFHPLADGQAPLTARAGRGQ